MYRFSQRVLIAASQRAVHGRNTRFIASQRNQVAYFASKKGVKAEKGKKAKAVDNVPDEFYDPEVETDKETLDVLSSLAYKEGSFARLDDMAITQDTLTWDEVHEARSQPLTPLPELTPEEEDELEGEVAKVINLSQQATDEREDDEFDGTLSASDDMVIQRFSALDIGEKEVFDEDFATSEELEHGISMSDGIDNPLDLFDVNAETNDLKDAYGGDDMEDDEDVNEMQELLNEFTPDDAPGKYTESTEGHAPCPGHRQRKGKTGKLACHKIDLDALHFMDTVTLSNYLTEDAEIMGKKDTGLCAKCQRKVSKAIKQARHFGILPHLGDYDMHEVEVDDADREQFHMIQTQKNGEGEKKYFKTSLKKVGI